MTATIARRTMLWLVAVLTVCLLVVRSMAGATALTTAVTGEATALTSSSATLIGYVYPANQQTSSYYEYGLTTAYGQQTALVALPSTSQTAHVHEAISGLSAYTTYHYRVVAVNTQGSTYGRDRTFTTRRIPLTFNLRATPTSTPFETPFSISGTLSGTGSTGRAVVLQADPFPYLGGFKTIGSPVLTNADGTFSLGVAGLSQNSQLRVATLQAPVLDSSVLVELVTVKVALHVRPAGRRGYARLYGTVTPAEVGAVVEFQLLRPGHTPTTVATTPILNGRQTLSRFSRVMHVRRGGVYRAFVDVRSGAQASDSSRALLVR